MTTKTAGQTAYELDREHSPAYHDGTPRPAWDQLTEVVQWSWERNPTARPVNRVQLAERQDAFIMLARTRAKIRGATPVEIERAVHSLWCCDGANLCATCQHAADTGMTLTQAIVASVKCDPRAVPEPCGRSGTARLSLGTMRDMFGAPHHNGDADKVTAIWHFRTPRGNVEVRDYWWNAQDELSIAGARAPSLWLAAYLRRLGIRADLGMPR